MREVALEPVPPFFADSGLKASPLEGTSERVEGLLPYLSPWVLQRLQRGVGALTEPTLEARSCVVLLTDLSGFTSLAERLAARGPSGTEALTDLLNRWFDALIELVATYGGEVSSFAGDGLIALWSSDDTALEDALLTALQCALHVQRLAADFEMPAAVQVLQPEDAPGLRLRASLGMGEGVFANLGGQAGRWEFLVVGEPLQEAAATDRLARPGDVTVSSRIWGQVESACFGELLPTGIARVTGLQSERSLPAVSARQAFGLGPVSEGLVLEILRGYLPLPIQDRLSDAQTHWLAELRRVSVVFALLAPSGPDLGRRLLRLQPLVARIQAHLAELDCVRGRIESDDKGIVLIAAFGLPPRTHEDDAARAVQAALEVRRVLLDAGQPVSVGVATGRVWSGVVGNPRRRDYTLIGDTVNLAARLMQIAGGEVLVDLETWQATQAKVDYKGPEFRPVKGKSRPVQVFRPIRLVNGAQPAWERPATEASGPGARRLVGRELERHQLLRQLQELVDGRGGVTLIEGESGIGKSALLHFLRERARESPVLQLRGVGDPVQQSAPFHAWRPVFMQLFHPGEQQGTREVARQRTLARLQLSASWLDLAPLLNVVLPLELPENSLTAQLSLEARGERTLALLLHLVQDTARLVPVLIVLDDGQWLDSASWALLLAVSRELPEVRVLLGLRPMAEPPPAYVALLQARQTVRLSLTGLQSTEIRLLVKTHLGVEDVPREVVELVRVRAEGHPLFTEQLLEALRGQDLIQIADGRCVLTGQPSSLQALSVPTTIEGTINARLDRLTPEQQLTLKVASVIGRSFSLELLQVVHPIERVREGLEPILDALVRLELLLPQAAHPHRSFAFKHSTIQEVAYNLLLFAQRRSLHRAVAEWYESRFADDLTSLYPLLSYHWTRAEVRERAVDCLDRAGTQAMRVYAYREALHFFRQAITLDQSEKEQDQPATLRRARWLRLMGEAHLFLGEVAVGRAALERSLSLMEVSRPQGLLMRLGHLGGALLLQVAHRLLPGLFIGRRRAQPWLLEASQACERLAESTFYSQEKTWGLYYAIRSLNLAEAYGPSPELARGYGNLSVAAGVVSLHGLARAYRSRAIVTARQVNQLDSTGWVMFLTAVYDVGVGQLEAAQAALHGTGTLYRRLGDRRRWEMASAWLAWVMALLGNLEGSLNLYREVFVSSMQRGDAQSRSWGLTGQLTALLRLGRTQEAFGLLAGLDPEGLPATNRLERSFLYGYYALAALQVERRQEAADYAERASELLLNSDTMVSTINALAALAQVTLTLWDERRRGDAGDVSYLEWRAVEVVRTLERFSRSFPLGRPQFLLWQGHLYRIRGVLPRALRSWRRAGTEARGLKMPYEEGQALLELGRHLPPGSGEPLACLERASRLFARLGARLEQAAAEELLRGRIAR